MQKGQIRPFLSVGLPHRGTKQVCQRFICVIVLGVGVLTGQTKMLVVGCDCETQVVSVERKVKIVSARTMLILSAGLALFV
jgi:hypothetical protein